MDLKVFMVNTMMYHATSFKYLKIFLQITVKTIKFEKAVFHAILFYYSNSDLTHL